MDHAIKDAIKRTAETFRTEPPKAQVTFRSESALQEGFRSRARLRSHELIIDEPTGIGGTDQGPTPVELILAALGACQEITYRAFATALGIPLEGVSVTVEGDIDFRGFFAIDPNVRPGFQALRVDVRLDSAASQAEIDRLIEMVNSHCPVLDMLSKPVPASLATTVNASTKSHGE